MTATDAALAAIQQAALVALVRIAADAEEQDTDAEQSAAA